MPAADLVLDNGDFRYGPGDETLPLSNDDNPLVGWSVGQTVGTGTIEAWWVADADGHGTIEFRSVSGVAISDEAYIEQIVAIPPSSLASSFALNLSSSLGVAHAQFLDINGAKTGTSGVQATRAFPNSNGSPPTDATSLQARIVATASSTTPTTIATARATSLGVGGPLLLVADRSDPSYGPGIIGIDSGVLLFATNPSFSVPHLTLDGDSGGITLTPQSGQPIYAAGFIEVDEQSAPTAATSNRVRIYAKSDGLLYSKDDAGTETAVSPVSGTFTPTLTFSTPGNVNVVYLTQAGRYTKIGNHVFYRIAINTSTFTHTTASGALTIGGLPFTVVNATSMGGVAVCSMSGWTRAGVAGIAFAPTINTTTGVFQYMGSGIALGNLAVGDMPTGGTVVIRATGAYEV